MTENQSFATKINHFFSSRGLADALTRPERFRRRGHFPSRALTADPPHIRSGSRHPPFRNRPRRHSGGPSGRVISAPEADLRLPTPPRPPESGRLHGRPRRPHISSRSGLQPPRRPGGPGPDRLPRGPVSAEYPIRKPTSAVPTATRSDLLHPVRDLPA